MDRLLNPLLAFAQTVGGPGLFIIAFLDSSFLSLPEINDLLIIWMVSRNEALMPYYATLATLGSVAGCLVLYVLGRRGGEAMLRKRFHPGRLDRAMAIFRRYGAMAILVPALLPPPAPFKVFILLAGVARVPFWTFVATVFVGRGTRYFGEGLLAVWYGDLAIDWLRANGPTAALAMGMAAFFGALAYYIWKSRRRTAPGEEGGV